MDIVEPDKWPFWLVFQMLYKYYGLLLSLFDPFLRWRCEWCIFDLLFQSFRYQEKKWKWFEQFKRFLCGFVGGWCHRPFLFISSSIYKNFYGRFLSESHCGHQFVSWWLSSVYQDTLVDLIYERIMKYLILVCILFFLSLYVGESQSIILCFIIIILSFSAFFPI